MYLNIKGIIIILCLIFFVALSLYVGYLNVKRDIKQDNKPNIDKYKFLKLIEQAVLDMNGYEFEEFAEYVFVNNGFKVVRTPKSRDGGKDLVLNGRIYVELKKYKDVAVTRETVQKLIGACAADNIKYAIFITTSRYTNDTIEYFKDKKDGVVKLNLWYSDDLLTLCENLDYRKTLIYLGYSIPSLTNNIKI